MPRHSFTRAKVDSVKGNTEMVGVEPDVVEAYDAVATAEPQRSADVAEEADDDVHTPTTAILDWRRGLVYGLLPALALLLALSSGFFKWQEATALDDDTARIESVQAAKDATAAMLSYQPNTVEQQLESAQGLLTGSFHDAYTQLINDVVIPGAKQKQVSAVATIPAASSVSATTDHAVTLVFVNQTTVIGNGPPTGTTSSVRVTLDKVNGRWLVSQFDPV